MYGLEILEADLNSKYEVEEVERFLNKFDLGLDKDIDYTLTAKEDGVIKATCSKSKNVLKCFAVDEDLRGEGVSSTLISKLIDKLFQEGIYHSFIFTKVKNIPIFSSLGYKVVHQVKEAALLEGGTYDINTYLDNLIKKYDITTAKKAAIVMNCNPFTLGHKYLIEKTAEENEEVIVFIVEEDKSIFPFEDRYNLVKKGTSHLKNVKVIPGGEYIISQATFPSYFLKEENVRLKAYTELDAGIFAKYFCSKLNINKRYVGNEPYCKVTSAYNDSLKDILSQYGVELHIIERRKSNDKEISASEVRKLIKENKPESLKDILPEVTLDYLNSQDGEKIIKKIKMSHI